MDTALVILSICALLNGMGRTYNWDRNAEIHKEVQRGRSYQFGGAPQLPDVEYKAVAIFALWAKENVKRFIASEAHCYSEELWTGGIVDLVYEDLTGKLVIMDFKSSKDAYLSQFFQDGGYRSSPLQARKHRPQDNLQVPEEIV